jgi:hypothetical protein
VIDMVRAKKNKGKLLVEFIPFGGIEVGGMFGEPRKKFKRKQFKSYFGKSYGGTKGASFGKAMDKGRKGWGIFIPRDK